jgi:ribose transport system permease protein
MPSAPRHGCSASPICAPGCSSPALIVGFEAWARISFGGTFILNPFNITSIAIFAVAPLLLATGQTFVIISGGIDLSLGFIMGLAAVVAAHVINWATPTLGLPFAVLLGFLVAMLIRRHSRPRQRIAGGAAARAALHRHARHVRRVPRRRLPPRRRHDGAGAEQFLRPARQWPLLQRALHRHHHRRLRAGDALHAQPDALRSAQLRHRRQCPGGAARRHRHQVASAAALYALGHVRGLAGVLYSARFNAGAAQAGEPLLLDSVAAVVIGGASLFGGSGTISAPWRAPS